MVHIVLVEPEIPQNCGNIARTCAATGCDLHLIRPLGFDISDRAVKRAGLDYWHLVRVFDYESLDDFFRKHPEAADDLWLATTKAPQDYCQARFREGCWLFFGKETAGLPEAFRTPAHGVPGPEPESQQLRGGADLRGAAAAGVPGVDALRGNGKVSIN